MNNTYKRIKNLFLRQSYQDSWENYTESIHKKSFVCWDYVIITASNEEQADVYREQLALRLDNRCLSRKTHYAVISDLDGQRVGSGGATFQVLRYIAERERSLGVKGNPFVNRRILVIHSGGDSKRVPQYSVIGKLFSPVPRELPDGRGSTLFDEIVIGMSGVPSRLKEGMVVLSGDVLVLFNSLQIDFQLNGAAAISVKENVEVGIRHGVFLNDGENYVKCFLHKQEETVLRKKGAVDNQGLINIDTGMIIFDSCLIGKLYSLISQNWIIVEEEFKKFVNKDVRLNFYSDFLYPLGKKASLEEYYRTKGEVPLNKQLLFCREKIWNVLCSFNLKLLCLSPAEFIHFGTTRELWKLVTKEVLDYEFLDWKKHTISSIDTGEYACYNSYIEKEAEIANEVYVENSYILGKSVINNKSIVSNVMLFDQHIPAETVFHGLYLQDGNVLVRVYGIEDNPKKTLEENGSFLGCGFKDFLKKNGLVEEEIWDEQEHSLWYANIYPICKTMNEALESALILYRMAKGYAQEQEIEEWKNKNKISLYKSFNKSDSKRVLRWQKELTTHILSEKFVESLKNQYYCMDALEIFGNIGVTEEIFDALMKKSKETELSMRIRIYYALACFMKKHERVYRGIDYETLEQIYFEEIQRAICNEKLKYLSYVDNYRIVKKEVKVCLPLRINWGGGWTDTPPYCNEQGGVVLNAAIKLKGNFPVQICVRKLSEFHIEFESQDIGATGIVKTVKEIQDCRNPYDPFSLHKAALIACGIIPIKQNVDLKEILKKIGGGIYISTQVIGVPKGSGLGTSSILAGACVKGIFEFLDVRMENEKIYDIVMCMEQIMSTGGGWQDQVGGMIPGIKLITSEPGWNQRLKIQNVILKEETKKELNERFVLIYTGQRRLARNLLREIMGKYVGSDSEVRFVMNEMKKTALLMKDYLEIGNIEAFAKLLDCHWELSKKLDIGTTNTCIDQILVACEDLIDGRFIAGAGGGGFLQVIMKKHVTVEQLKKRIYTIFQDSGIDVWKCEILI